MRSLLLCCIILCFTSICLAQNGVEKRSIEILANSELTITGDTNISKFRCEFDTKLLERTIPVIFEENSGHIIFENAVLSLSNKGFDCGNKAINKDFHHLMKTEKYPEISLELLDIRLQSKKIAHANIIIKMAGRQKRYTFPIDITTTPVDSYRGKLTLNINDFGLEPPKKMFGLIVIKEDIEIDFNLMVKK